MKIIFDGSQKIIGKGAQAEVLLYHGFAYKVYKESYPAEWIAFEKKQQQAVNKAGLWLDRGRIFGKAGEGFERMNTACPKSVLEEALNRIKTGISNYG